MPRLAVSQDEQMNRVIRGSIKNGIELQGMDVPKVSKLTGIPESTLYQRLQYPGNFRVCELRLIFKVLRYKEDDKERFAREAI